MPLEKNPDSSTWHINKTLLDVAPSASSLTDHSPPHSLMLQLHWPPFCLSSIPDSYLIEAFTHVSPLEFSVLTLWFSALISQGPSLTTLLKNDGLFHHSVSLLDLSQSIVGVCVYTLIIVCLTLPRLWGPTFTELLYLISIKVEPSIMPSLAIKNVLIGNRT